MPELTCPGCGRAMRALALPRDPLVPLSIDACDDCQALWLDATESQQLTPGALIALFRAIGSSRQVRRSPYPALLPCPRCTTPLTLTQDVRGTTRFT
ncbi:MAG TPA: zf-TFIIB domain-containing protein, partial [Casimicrobiaceae bacterium]